MQDSPNHDSPDPAPPDLTLEVVGVPVRLAGGRYRPLVIGAAWLERPTGAGPWLVRLAAGGWLRPEPRMRGPGLAAWALLCPEDLGGDIHTAFPAAGWRGRRPGTSRHRQRPSHAGSSPRGRAAEIHGWCLMYRPPEPAGGDRRRSAGACQTGRVAVVDASPAAPHLPALFELPGELFDRLEHLAAHGIPARPLALPTCPVPPGAAGIWRR